MRFVGGFDVDHQQQRGLPICRGGLQARPGLGAKPIRQVDKGMGRTSLKQHRGLAVEMQGGFDQAHHRQGLRNRTLCPGDSRQLADRSTPQLITDLPNGEQHQGHQQEQGGLALKQTRRWAIAGQAAQQQGGRQSHSSSQIQPGAAPHGGSKTRQGGVVDQGQPLRGKGQGGTDQHEQSR